MKFQKMSAVALTGFCSLLFAVAPQTCIGAEGKPTSDSATTETKAESSASAAKSDEPGKISNSHITYQEDPNACFNHEVSGAFTLVAGERGAIAQLFYGVTYDGEEAAFRHEADLAPQPYGFESKTTQTTKNGKIATDVRSSDGAITVRTESSIGKGPYVVRKMEVTNTSKKPLNKVRLLVTVNPDTLDWENETGKVEKEGTQVHVTNPDKNQWVGLAADPKPAYLSAGDVMSFLDAEAGSNWSDPSASFTGNVAVQAGWEVGPLEPGKSKTVTLTLATTENEKDLGKALTGGEFSDK